jgi:maltooligosyltrehalose trehalohydrolase
MSRFPQVGAKPLGNGRVQFGVWAPNCDRVDVQLISPHERTEPLERDSWGNFTAVLDGVDAGSTYVYVLDGELERPDPASRFQPDGVHGPSMIVDPAAYDWRDEAWRGIPLDRYVIYEMHVGTFSPEGTFDGAIAYLDDLADLGITSVEILPVAQFPGDRNWGYDGVGLFAVQNSYGGPDELRRFVDACHQRGMAVILDVVYNHLGPEGNYLRDFGPYFTDHYQTPWGEALNFDGPQSDHVRHFFVENARYWLREYRVDGFRFDAVHAIYDSSATHILEELTTTIDAEAERRGLPAVTIAESDLNDPKVIRSSDLGGWGYDSQWADDFHHALHAMMTGERDGYYVDYGTVEHLATTLRQGYMFTGQYSNHRERCHGRWSGIRDGRRFVVCSQNHDQVGNRATGDRLTTSLTFDQLKVVAGVTILSPFVPMLFQGEEYAEPNPFQYFVSHGDPDLVKAVQEGRKREFQAFNWQVEVPDPQAESTFEHSKLNRGLKDTHPHDAMFAWYRELLRVRRETAAYQTLDLSQQEVETVPGASALVMRRYDDDDECLMLVNFGARAVTVPLAIERGQWHCLLNSHDDRWDGSGHPAPEFDYEHGTTTVHLEGRSFLVFQRV